MNNVPNKKEILLERISDYINEWYKKRISKKRLYNKYKHSKNNF
jgi:hypothetical protein